MSEQKSKFEDLLDRSVDCLWRTTAALSMVAGVSTTLAVMDHVDEARNQHGIAQPSNPPNIVFNVPVKIRLNDWGEIPHATRTPNTVTGEQRVAIIPVAPDFWGDEHPRHDNRFDDPLRVNARYGEDGAMDSYVAESTGGELDLALQVFPQVVLEIDPEICDYSAVKDSVPQDKFAEIARRAEAEATGYDRDEFDSTLILFDAECGLGLNGTALPYKLPDTAVLLIDNPMTAFHELFHTFGLSHAAASIGERGRSIPDVYGDHYDVMGSRDEHLKVGDDAEPYVPDLFDYRFINGFEMWQLGLLGEEETITVDDPGEYHIGRLDAASGKKQLLRIPKMGPQFSQRGDGRAYDWLELSPELVTPEMLDCAFLGGSDCPQQEWTVKVRESAAGPVSSDDHLRGFGTYLQGVGLGGYENRGLKAGEYYEDPLAGVRVEVLDIDADGATIAVGAEALDIDADGAPIAVNEVG